MSASRQPSLTLSPNTASAKIQSPQTTPKLPKRERLNSISRLLKNKNFAELSGKSCKSDKKSRAGGRFNLRAKPKPSVDIRVSPCSPSTNRRVEAQGDMLLKSAQGFLSPNRLPFSPRLLHRASPTYLSPSYQRPSPLRSPLYSPDRHRIFLGRGSFGKVTLCKYKGRDFAVKIIHSQMSTMIGEQNLLGIRHPHLVEIFHISSALEETLVFMEFAGLCNLQQVLDTKSHLDFRRRLSFCIQTALGLRHCHQNQIIHGDVKPANVMVSPKGVCKLGDFGNSTRADQDERGHSTSSKDVVGTAAYAAPEVLKGSRPVKLSDVYSFGVFLWQLHMREMPFAGEHPHVVIYKVVNYGTRPKFREDANPVLSRFAKVAEDCWRTVPSQRMDMGRAITALQSIMQSIKESDHEPDFIAF